MTTSIPTHNHTIYILKVQLKMENRTALFMFPTSQEVQQWVTEQGLDQDLNVLSYTTEVFKFNSLNPTVLDLQQPKQQGVPNAK
jgi:hypothetical protein